MADPNDPLGGSTSDPFGFRQGPSLNGVMTPVDLWARAVETPLSRTQTFFGSGAEGAVKSPVLGTTIRGFMIPEGRPDLLGPTLLGTIETAESLIPGGGLWPLAKKLYQSTYNEDQPQMTEDEYKKSRYYRTEVPWDAAMTEQRAAALAEWYDTAKRREYFGSKRPWISFFGGLAGAAIDPANFVPVGGPLVKAAAAYNLMKVAGPAATRFLAPMLTSSFDATTNVALTALMTRGERGRYGDDISFQATMMQIGMGALIGAGFGALHGAWGVYKGRVTPEFDAAFKRIQQEKLGTLATTQRSLIPLNEAIDRTLHGEEPNLSPNGIDAIRRATTEGQVRAPDIEAVMTRRMTDAGLAPDEAANNAAVIRAFHETQAERLGITTEEYTARHGLPEFRSGGPSPAEVVAAEIAGLRPAQTLEQGVARSLEEIQARRDELLPGLGGVAAERGAVPRRVVLPDLRIATIEHPDPETFRVTTEDGQRLGELRIITRHGAPYATGVQVGPKRQGIATALYDAAEAVLGRRMVPSPLGISDEAIAFWRARLSRLEPSEKQAILAETLRMGQEARVGKNTRKLVDRLGYVEPGATFFQRGAPLVDERPLPVTPTGGKNNNVVTVKDVADALDADHQATVGRKLYPETSEEDHAHVLSMAEEEVGTQLTRENSGVGWYDKDTREAIDLTARVFPTLKTNPTHRNLYLTIAGIFSNGIDPDQAWIAAANAFRAFLRDGEIPVVRDDGVMTTYIKEGTGERVHKQAGWTMRDAANRQQLGLLKYLVKREGSLDKAFQWLMKRQSREDINELMTGSGLYKDGRYKTKVEKAGEDEYGTLAFGPKLGRYMLGLNGIEITEANTTVDKWYVRSFRRWTGRLKDGPLDKEGMPGQPANEAERQAVFRITGDLLRKYKLKAGDIQAVLWYFEKRLYGAHGIRTEEGSNSVGARTLLRQLGIDDRTAGDGQGVGAGRADQPGGAVQHPEGAGTDRGADAGTEAGAGEGQTFYQSARPQVGVAFVSPNVENLDFAGSQAALGGERQRSLRTASSEVDRQLGLSTSDHDVIGAWSDGAENSTMSVVQGGDWDTMVVSAAMKGHLADQKSVLVFKEGEPEGTSTLYTFEAKGSLDDIHNGLLEDGVAFHTIVPKDGGATIYVADLDGSAAEAVEKAAERHGTKVDAYEGRAKFIGTTKEDGTAREQRDDARRAYEEIIGESPVRGASAVWEGVHNRWGEALTRPEPEAGAGRAIGETDKEFAKRVVDKRPEPAALPEKYDDYFIMKGAKVVPIEDLVSSKTDAENLQGGTNAAKRMEAAANGELSKRPPITVEQRSDGKYLIKDGNGTYTSVKGYGWKSMPVLVEDKAPLFQVDRSSPYTSIGKWFSQPKLEAFKRWFAGSKVILRDGRANVLFHHGIFNEVTDIPREGMHFGTAHAAQDRAVRKIEDDALEGIPAEEGAGYTAVFLSIKNPKRTRDVGIHALNGGRNPRDAWAEEIAKAKAEGHDGIVYENSVEDKGKDSWVAFYPEQVKSVNNAGMFDPADPHTLRQSGARGMIQFSDLKTVITLFKDADASTALHETGHYFLKLFKQMAERDGAPAGMVDDWNVVKDWWRSNAEAVVRDSGMDGVAAADVHAVLDTGTTGDAAKDAAIDRGLHEQWARGFERYLREGQAPSPGLARVFEQFKTWLTKIYKKAKDLDVELSPELRGVFDRMLGGKEAGYKLGEDDFLLRPHRTFDEIYAVATERQNELNDIGQGIADELGVEFKTSPDGPKLRSTAENKMGVKGYDSPSQITDIVRAGFLLDVPEKADAIIARLAEHFDVMDEGWKVTDAGYFDRKALVRFDDGTVAEIQMWEPKVLHAKEERGAYPEITGTDKNGHDIYKEMLKHPKNSPEYVRLESEQKVLYGKALSEAGPSWEPVVAEGLEGLRTGKVSRPNLSKRSRQAASDISPAFSQTSGQSTSFQGAPGLSLAHAVRVSGSETAGRPSQLENLRGIVPPSMSEGSRPPSVKQPAIDTTAARPEPPPEGLKEASATVGKAETPKGLAEQFGIDLATGEFDELADIEVMRSLGRLTPEDEAAMKAADETAEAAEAYGNTLKAALFCIV
jgi:hypothetical protein